MKKILVLLSVLMIGLTLAGCTEPKEDVIVDDCPVGQHIENEICVDDEDLTCPEGQHLENDVCVDDVELTCPTGEHIEDGNCVIDEVNCAENYEIVDGICYNILIDTFKESLGTSDIVFEDITSTLDLTGLGIEKVELFTNSEITDGYIYTAMFNGDFQDVRYMIAFDNNFTTVMFKVIDNGEFARYGGKLSADEYAASIIGKSLNELIDERFDTITGATNTVNLFKASLIPLVTFHKVDILNIIDVDGVFCQALDLDCIEEVEALIDDMTLMEKVAQMVQAERGGISPTQVTQYGIGSILSGGGSHPSSFDNTADDWFNMYEDYQNAALQSGSGVPLIYGIDAVHGNNNLYGATIFPHNIGLGMANDADLMFRIGAATSREIKVTGISWNFAPALSVVQDISWGRTYEGFSENPEIHLNLTYSTIMGMQQYNVSATAKHFFGDGGTFAGVDRGNTVGTEEYLREIHLAPYYEAIRANVDTIMISYSSINGEKMHGYDYWINDVLKDEMGFEGFIISDWAAIYELGGSFDDQLVDSVNAGVDMLMMPYNWENTIHRLYNLTMDGRISENRVDDAVRRILTVKYNRNLLSDPLHRLSVEDNLYTQEHQDLAREAVRKSLVLLKNENNVLPLDKGQKIFLTGPGADNVGLQLGGWSRYWQGTTDADFGYGNSIYDAFIEVLTANGGEIVTNYNDADVVVVVLTEDPYAEGNGDNDNLTLTTGNASAGNAAALQTALAAHNAGKQVVGVLISGRPLILGDHLDSFDGFIAAWLPGSEGGHGIADVMFGDYDFTGKLSFTWPIALNQVGETSNDAGYNPADYQYPYGYGLKYNN